MNILTFSSEKLDLLNNDIKSLTEEKSTLEAASVEKLWMNDLNELEQEYVNKCLKVDGEESKQGSFYDRSRFEAEDDEEDEPVESPPKNSSKSSPDTKKESKKRKRNKKSKRKAEEDVA